MRKSIAVLLVGLWGLFTVAVFFLTSPNETVSDHACLAVDAGEVCAELQQQLQLAVARNATNMYKLKKVFSTPFPAVVNVIYDVSYTVPCNWAHDCKDDVDNVTKVVEYHQTVPSMCVSDYSGTYNFMWTDRAIYTIYCPAALRQVQPAILYLIIERTTRSPLVHSAARSEMDTLLWSGCNPEEIATITLSLEITASSVIPTQDQLNTSLQELTTWLQAFTDVRFGETLPNLDTGKKHFAILPNPPSKFPSKDRELIHHVMSVISTLLVCLFMGESTIVGWQNITKIFPVNSHKKAYQWAFWPSAFVIFVWNLQVLCAEIYSLCTQCSPSDINPAAYKWAMLIFLLAMIPRAWIANKPEDVPLPKFLRHHPQQNNPHVLIATIIRIIASLALWNVVALVQFATVGVIMGMLLASAYPTQVFAAAVTTIAIPFSCVNLSIMLYMIYEEWEEAGRMDRMASIVSFFAYVLGAIFILFTVEFGLSILEAIILDVASTIGGVPEFGVTVLPTVVLGLTTWMLNYLFTAAI